MNKPTPTPAANPEQPEPSSIPICIECKSPFDQTSSAQTCCLKCYEEMREHTPPTPAVITPSAETQCPDCLASDCISYHCRACDCTFDMESSKPAPSAETASETPRVFGAWDRANSLMECWQLFLAQAREEKSKLERELTQALSALQIERAEKNGFRQSLNDTKDELTQAQADLRAAQQERDAEAFRCKKFIALSELETKERREAQRQLAAAQQALDAAREALKPFVSHYAPWMDVWPDDSETHCFPRHTFGDVRKARAAIAGEKGAGL